MQLYPTSKQNLRSDVSCSLLFLIVFLIALLHSRDNTDTDWWNGPLSKPIHSQQINSCLSPLQLNESLRLKWGAFQFRRLSSREKGRSFVWKSPSRLSVWFSTLLWGDAYSLNKHTDVQAILIGSIFNEKMPGTARIISLLCKVSFVQVRRCTFLNNIL